MQFAKNVIMLAHVVVYPNIMVIHMLSVVQNVLWMMIVIEIRHALIRNALILVSVFVVQMPIVLLQIIHHIVHA